MSQTPCCLWCELTHSTHKWEVSGLGAQLNCGRDSAIAASAPCPAPVVMLKVTAVDHLGQLQGKHRCLETPPSSCSQSLCVYCSGLSSSWSSLRELQPGGAPCLSFSVSVGMVSSEAGVI